MYIRKVGQSDLDLLLAMKRHFLPQKLKSASVHVVLTRRPHPAASVWTDEHFSVRASV